MDGQGKQRLEERFTVERMVKAIERVYNQVFVITKNLWGVDPWTFHLIAITQLREHDKSRRSLELVKPFEVWKVPG